jgi:hypothetical protein
MRKYFESKTVPSDAKKFPPNIFVWEQEGYIAYVHSDGKGSIALQGTTGRFKDAKDAFKLAREIAEKCPDYVNKTQKDKKLSDGDAATFRKYFLDALQGAASNQDLKTADQVVTKAGEEAYLSLAEHLKTRARLHWKHVTLPQPMDADCKPVAGKVHGPPNHKLCEFHDHIIDMETKMVIAHSLEEYQKQVPMK